MNIQGFQKLTLLDYPEKVACTIFTGGCNFRCPFCHNASLVVGEQGNIIPIERQGQRGYTEDEVLAYLKKRQGILDGVCITGGEPLLQKDLESFIVKVRELGFLIKLDTNGSYPEKLDQLIGKGLIDYVAMDIKNSIEHYGETIGIENYDTTPIEKSVALLLKGNVEYEFRTTVTKEFHKAEDISQIGAWIKDAPRYFLQQFVDSGDVIGRGLHPCDEEEMKAWIGILQKTIPEAKLRGV